MNPFNYPLSNQIPDDCPFWWSADRDHDGRVWLKPESRHCVIISQVAGRGLVWICEEKRFCNFVTDYDKEFIVKSLNPSGYWLLMEKVDRIYREKMIDHKNEQTRIREEWKRRVKNK